MDYRTLTLFLIAIINSCCGNNDELGITLTGDVILDRGVKDELKLHGHNTLINSLKEFKGGNYFIINYEGTFTTNEKSQRDKYNFKVNGNAASWLYIGGITHVSVANNHSYDYGKTGFTQTIDALNQNTIKPLGESCFPEILENKNFRCAILAVSLTTNNELFCISSINSLKKSVKDFNAINSSIPLILYIHWGLEFQPKPEKWQKDLAKDLIGMGVDAIIGHHPHIVQTVEFIDGAPVFYSIGNFIADAYLPLTYESIAVNFKIKDKIDEIRIIPVDIKSYFPAKIEGKDQINLFVNFLQYSNEIGVINSGDSWIVKETKDIDFSEASDLWLFSACDYVVAIKRLEYGSNLLTLLLSEGISNSIGLHGKLSELKVGDIDNDGKEDILLGIEKKVKFDSKVKKRINIYSYRDGYLQALWLGTKFIYDIVSFNVFQSKRLNYLATIEVDSLGNYYKGIYEWDNFGFSLNSMKPINRDKGIEANENY